MFLNKKSIFIILSFVLLNLQIFAQDTSTKTTDNVMKITVNEDANIRVSPDVNSDVITIAKKGDSFTGVLSSENEKWYKITVDNKDGFIHKSVVTASQTSSTSAFGGLIPVLIIVFIVYRIIKKKRKENKKNYGNPFEEFKNLTLKLKDDEPLPVIKDSNLVLKNGEVCHFKGKAQYLKTKNVVIGHTGKSGGISTRIVKGVYLHSGTSGSQAIRGDIQETSDGVLSITNKRIVFSGEKWSFDKPIASLSSITPYSDGLGFQFGSNQHTVLVSPSKYVYQIVARIINESGNED